MQPGITWQTKHFQAGETLSKTDFMAQSFTEHGMGNPTMTFIGSTFIPR